MTQFDLIKDIWAKFLLISLISTALVIATTGLVSQGLLKRKERKVDELFWHSNFGVLISIIAFEIGIWLNKKTKSALVNPLIIAIVLVVVFFISL